MRGRKRLFFLSHLLEQLNQIGDHLLAADHYLTIAATLSIAPHHFHPDAFASVSSAVTDGTVILPVGVGAAAFDNEVFGLVVLHDRAEVFEIDLVVVSVELGLLTRYT